MAKVTQIKIGNHQTGIIGLEDVLKKIAKEGKTLPDEKLGELMVKKLSKSNYITPSAVDLYQMAFLR